MKLVKFLCLKCRWRSFSKACESLTTKLPPPSPHEITSSVAGSETMSYTFVRNGATSDGFGTTVPFAVEAPISPETSPPTEGAGDAAAGCWGDCFLELMETRKP